MSSPKYHQVKEFIRVKYPTRRLGGWWENSVSGRALKRNVVSGRITIKKAVADLLTEGVLEHLPGKKGSFVRNSHPYTSVQAKLIAVAVDDVRDTFGAEILRGIEDYLWEKKFHTLICNNDRDFNKVEHYFESLAQQQVGGGHFFSCH